MKVVAIKTWMRPRMLGDAPAIGPEIEDLSYGGTALIRLMRYPGGASRIEKRLLPRFQSIEDFEGLQRREFEILSSLSHPLIVRALDSRVQASQTGGETLVLYLEAIDGVPLSNLRPYLEKLPREERVQFTAELRTQLTSILLYLRSKNIIHGDIAPENLMVQQNGLIRLIDFGVARSASQSELPVRVQGRPYFRAPEIRDTGKTSFEADLFAAGRVLEEVLGPELAIQYSEFFEDWCLARRLDDSLHLHAGWFDGFQNLPDLREFKSTLKPRVITEVIPRERGFHLSRHALTAIFAFLAWPCLSSPTPQRSWLTVNTLPSSSVLITGSGMTHYDETPLRDLEITSGHVRFEFVIPSQGNRRIVRELNARSMEHVKIFEDFRKLDTLRK